MRDHRHEGPSTSAVALVDLKEPDEAVEALRATNATVSGYTADVSDPGSVKALVAPITETLGAPDILVNNAGIYPFLKLEETTIEDWRGACSPSTSSRFCLRRKKRGFLGMKQRGWVSIVNITSRTRSHCRSPTRRITRVPRWP